MLNATKARCTTKGTSRCSLGPLTIFRIETLDWSTDSGNDSRNMSKSSTNSSSASKSTSRERTQYDLKTPHSWVKHRPSLDIMAWGLVMMSRLPRASLSRVRTTNVVRLLLVHMAVKVSWWETLHNCWTWHRFREWLQPWPIQTSRSITMRSSIKIRLPEKTRLPTRKRKLIRKWTTLKTS